MTGQEKIQRAYMIRVRKAPEQAEAYQISYMPRGLQQARAPAGRPKRVPEYKAVVQINGRDAPVQWEAPPTDPEAGQEDFDQDARRRARIVHEWLGMLSRLIGTVRGWVEEGGWATKEIEKPMEDSEAGNYKAPALLLQMETTKVLLEPVARAAPGVEGVVDLYQMPAYDDIASLYYYGNRWNIHYLAPGEPAVGNIREAESKPLTKASLRRVLEEMTSDAE
jgi:hypothetical protein